MKNKFVFLTFVMLCFNLYGQQVLIFENISKERIQEAVFLNPAMLYNTKSPELCLVYSILYPKLTDETKFVYNSICFVNKLFDGGLGIGYNQFGIKDWYTKDKFVFSYGRTIQPYLSNFDFGIKLVYEKETYSLDDYMKTNPVFKKGNTVGYFSLSLAARYVLNNNNVFTLVADNLNQPNTGLYTAETLPLVFNFAYKYKYKKLNISPAIKYEFSILTNYSFIVTTEYEFLVAKKAKFVPVLSIEYGSRELNKIFLGFEIKTSAVSINYGYNVSPMSKLDVGANQYIAVSYKFIPEPVEEEKVSKKEYDKLLAEKQQIEQQLEQLKKYYSQVKETKPTTEIKTEQQEVQPAEQQLTTEEILLKKLEELEQKLKEVETKKVEEKPKVVSPPPTTTTPATVPKKRYHTVVTGDTLPKLAEKYYGDSSQWRKIYDANKDKIIRGQLIPGTVIEIP